MSLYSVYGETMTGIADAVRHMRYEKGTLTPAQIISKINASIIGMGITLDSHIDPSTGQWVRPEGYPNLDALKAQIPANTDCVYMTYDLTKTPGCCFIALSATTQDGTAWTIERGHVADGAFVADFTATVNSSSAYRADLDSANGNVQLWRATTASQFRNVYFVGTSDTAAQNISAIYQPCVERAGKLTNYKYFPGNPGVTQKWSTYWLERCSVNITFESGQSTTLYGLYADAFNLQSVDLSNWDTRQFSFTSLEAMFRNCINLQSIDMSALDVTGWSATTMYNTFNGCVSLRTLNLGNIPTLKIKNYANTFSGCCSLLSLDMSKFDTSETTSMNGMFNLCGSLQALDLSRFNTANVTTMASMFNNCTCLKSLDLSSFNTANVTAMSSMFYRCVSLHSLNISSFNFAKLTTMASMFSECYALETIDMSRCTAGSLLTATGNMLNNDYSLREVKYPADIGMGSSVTGGNATGLVPNIASVETYTGTKVYVDHSLGTANRLSKASLVSILDRLPTVSGKTITLGVTNKNKLTAEEIAVATAKGWTVA